MKKRGVSQEKQTLEINKFAAQLERVRMRVPPRDVQGKTRTCVSEKLQRGAGRARRTTAVEHQDTVRGGTHRDRKPRFMSGREERRQRECARQGLGAAASGEAWGGRVTRSGLGIREDA